MGGIKIDIQSGQITHLPENRKVTREVRSCLSCDNEFEAKRWQATRYCSISCSKKGQNNRLGQKHTLETKQKMSLNSKDKIQVEIQELKKTKRLVPYARLKLRSKKPHFVKDPHQWANAIYGKYKGVNRVPSKRSDDYGLYKYGEWLFNNETFTNEKTNN